MYYIMHHMRNRHIVYSGQNKFLNLNNQQEMESHK